MAWPGTSSSNNHTIPVRASVVRMMQVNLMLSLRCVDLPNSKGELMLFSKKKGLLYGISDISAHNFIDQMTQSCRMLFRI